MSFIYTMNIDAGATFTRQFEYLNDDGTPFDLSDFTALFQARFKPDTDLVLESEPEIDVETGMVSLTLTSEETASLVREQYVYAMELIHTTGEPVIRLVGGTILVSPEVVRPEGS
jgi:hypothetical protein